MALLLDHGAMSSVRNYRNETPLHCAHNKVRTIMDVDTRTQYVHQTIIELLQSDLNPIDDPARVGRTPESFTPRLRSKTAPSQQSSPSALSCMVDFKRSLRIG